MSKIETDYSNTIIYKIVCKDTCITDLYIGHTTDFVQRKKSHKYNSNCNYDNHSKLYNVIRANSGWDNWDMLMLEFFKCNNSIEARQKEQEYYERLKPTLNSVPPFLIQPIHNNVIKIPIIKNNLDCGMLNCNRCGYETKHIGNLKTHLQRKNPCKAIKQDINILHQFNELFLKEEKDFKCKYCDKSYNQQQGKSRHEKTCKNKNCENKSQSDFNNIQNAETINNYNTNIENQNNITNKTTNNIIINGFGFETITHVIEDPEFFEKIKNLITNNEVGPALIQLYLMLLLEPKNKNLILEKANSRYIKTQDENGKKLKKTKTECYNNIMVKLRQLFIKYLEKNCDYKFRFKTIVRTNIIKRQLEINNDSDDDYEKDVDEEIETVNEIKNGFMDIITKG